MPPSPQKKSGREFIVASDKLWFRPLFWIPEVFAYESLFDSTVIFCLFQMENIGKYLKFCEEQLGVPKGDQFQTVDLYEKQNMANVSIKNNILKTKLQLKNVINNSFTNSL